MPKAEIKLEDEFASTMQQLVAEAKKVVPLETPKGTDAGGELLNELLVINDRISDLERMIAGGFARVTEALPVDDGEMGEQLQRIDDHFVGLRTTESVNQRLFNSLHQELKSYRDNFLRESLQKPFIRDLVVLFDDLTALATQMETAAAEARGAVALWTANLQNAIHSLVEMLHRMEVVEIEQKEMVDRALHRVVSYEPADFAEDDGRIVMRLKRGFLWRDQVLRPEEVVAKRFQ